MKTSDTKYLTQMKELPPEAEEEIPVEKRVETPVLNKSDSLAPTKEKEVPPIRKEENLDESLEEEISSERVFTSKDIILGIVNFVSILLLILILIALPKKAKQLNELEIERLLAESNANFKREDIRVNLEKADQMKNLFLNESGLVDFVSAVEKIKREGGTVKKVSFASQVAVKDRSGNFGIPVVIELVGGWEKIDEDLQKIDKLPFLFRPANIQIEPSKDKEREMEFKYGIFLYVDEKLGEGR